MTSPTRRRSRSPKRGLLRYKQRDDPDKRDDPDRRNDSNRRDRDDYKRDDYRRDDNRRRGDRSARGHRDRPQETRRETKPYDRRRENKPPTRDSKPDDRENKPPTRNNKPDDRENKVPARASAPVVGNQQMIIVTVNDRLGTKAQIPCLASDPVKVFKAMVAARIGRAPHEIMLKRQGERPFKDQLTLEDYGVSNGVQIDLELDTGD